MPKNLILLEQLMKTSLILALMLISQVSFSSVVKNLDTDFDCQDYYDSDKIFYLNIPKLDLDSEGEL